MAEETPLEKQQGPSQDDLKKMEPVKQVLPSLPHVAIQKKMGVVSQKTGLAANLRKVFTDYEKAKMDKDFQKANNVLDKCITDMTNALCDAITEMITAQALSVTTKVTTSVVTNPGQAVQVAVPAGTGSSVSPGTGSGTGTGTATNMDFNIA